MKLYIDPITKPTKGYSGKSYYERIGCKKVLTFRDFNENDEKENDLPVVSVAGDFSFVTDPLDADLVLVRGENVCIGDYLVKTEQIDDICLKTIKSIDIELDDWYVSRHHPLLFMFGAAIRKITIGEYVEEIVDYPNAFQNCKNLQGFEVDKNNKKFYSFPYSQWDGFYKPLFQNDVVLENNDVGIMLHTFPPNPPINHSDELFKITCEKISTDAFIGPIKGDFLKINNVKEWVVPSPEVVGQRVIFISENENLVQFLLSRRLKAINEDQYYSAVQSYSKEYIRHAFDDYFKRTGGYLNNTYKGEF